jgi:pre-mRNA-processing factor 17
LACQSLDNQILIYGTGEKLKLNSKKFQGHVIAGYACQVAWSPDSRFVCSGDSTGSVWFWDWKTGRGVRKTVGKGVVMDVEWAPQQSLVACAGWDGNVNLLE